MSSEASLLQKQQQQQQQQQDKSLRNPNTHWPQRSLFGSNIDAQTLMANINYKKFLNGDWKKERHEKLKKTKSLHMSESPALVELRNQLEEQKAKLKQKEVRLVETKEKALNFNTNVSDSTVPVIDDVISNRAKSPKVVGIKTFHNINTATTATPATNYIQYQLMGSIMDIGRQYRKPEQLDTTASTKSAPAMADNHRYNLQSALSETSEYNAIQMKHMNAYYPSRLQFTEAFRSANDRIKSSVSSKSSISIDEVPQNIKHRFRAKQSNELMKDQLKVEQTIAQMQSIENSKKHLVKAVDDIKVSPATPARPVSGRIDPIKNSEYYDMSNYLRHTICHGYPDLKKRSFKEHVHNEYVNKEYLSDPANYQMLNRRKKDWLVAWIGANHKNEELLQAFMERQKEEPVTSVLKLPMIRTAKPAPGDKLTETKTKAKSDNNNKVVAVAGGKTKKKSIKNVGFPDFKFEDVPEVENEAEEVEKKKDDDFWNYYNQQ